MSLFKIDVVKLHVYHRRGRECHSNDAFHRCGGRRLLVVRTFDLPKILGDEPALVLHLFTVLSNFTAIKPLNAQDYFSCEVWVLGPDLFACETIHFRLRRRFLLFPLRRQHGLVAAFRLGGKIITVVPRVYRRRFHGGEVGGRLMCHSVIPSLPSLGRTVFPAI